MNSLEKDIEKLSSEFAGLNWSFKNEKINEKNEIISYWPGDEKEDVMVCVLQSNHINEQFHRQDFFFINYAYENDYNALSLTSDNLITVKENECYIGQPYSGYALKGDSKKDITIIGILIQKSAFFREYLPAISSDSSMLHFFLDPQTNSFSDNFIHLHFQPNHPLRHILELMVTEYANKQEDTQVILKPLTLAALMYIAREHRNNLKNDHSSLIDQILQYINRHLNTITLQKLAENFSYHPNYLSTLIHQKTGKSFSEILLEQKMDRSLLLLENTNLTVEEIASILGYNNKSNFYRAFKSFYNQSPRNIVIS